MLIDDDLLLRGSIGVLKNTNKYEASCEKEDGYDEDNSINIDTSNDDE